MGFFQARVLEWVATSFCRNALESSLKPSTSNPHPYPWTRRVPDNYHESRGPLLWREEESRPVSTARTKRGEAAKDPNNECPEELENPGEC